MPTKNPRIHVVLEKPLFENLKGLAKKMGLSVSMEARELIREALHSSGKKTPKIYKGKNMKELIGAYPMGKINLEEELVKQVHG